MQTVGLVFLFFWAIAFFYIIFKTGPRKKRSR
jgi:hypothetical protein